LTESIFATEHAIDNQKESCRSTGTSLHAPKFRKLWSTNGWRVFAHPQNLAHSSS